MLENEKLLKILSSQGLQKIMAVLSSSQAVRTEANKEEGEDEGAVVRLVGGCVRDLLSDRTVYDIDIATIIKPEQVMQILRMHGIKVIPTGLKHGTITALYGSSHYEITTLRQDISCDGRRAEVSYTNSWQADAARRDFTVNAIYLDMEGKVYDYFDGISDLKKSLIRFIGDPKSRIAEDYLRILRYYRFLGYYGVDNLDEDSNNSCIEMRANLAKLSGERVALELKKIMNSKHAEIVVELMLHNGIFSALSISSSHANVDSNALDSSRNSLSFIKKNKNEDIDHYFAVNSFLLLRFVAKYDEKQKVSPESCMRLARILRLSNRDIKILKILTDYQNPGDIADTEHSHKVFIYQYGYDIYEQMLEYYKAIGHKHVLRISNWEIPRLPISGDDVKNLGYIGPEIGEKLQLLEARWRESNFSLSRQDLLRLASEL